ncbi:MAG TPA: TIGR00159 family protein [Lachnospiraceae bacterium]|jgi:diadenylate cyclase|nr:TIGR00159 family protein [Lachnospiraceae bacterium]
MQRWFSILQNFFSTFHMPVLRISDVVEVCIIAFLIYHILAWVKNTRAWSLLMGVLVIAAFVILAALFNMTTILWIVRNVMGTAVIAMVVILQPELRNAIEELGQRNILSSLVLYEPDRKPEGRFSDQTVSEIITACLQMAKVKTGALIVIQNKIVLNEYKRLGIDVDGIVTSQLLINIFEKNTPLHDGAVIIVGDRVASATCYLPLSENKMDKELGTRHRAGVGISEVSDSLTFIVSEETGEISMAMRGNLRRGVTEAEMREALIRLQDKEESEEKRSFIPLWKGTGSHEKDKRDDSE